MSSTEIQSYNNLQSQSDQDICNLLMSQIMSNLKNSTYKIRHWSPVWFLDGNPLVWYGKQKKWICLLFWSGQDFEEDWLSPEWKFKAAQIVYTYIDQINTVDLNRRLDKSKIIQRDYKNIVKRKWLLEKL